MAARGIDANVVSVSGQKDVTDVSDSDYQRRELSASCGATQKAAPTTNERPNPGLSRTSDRGVTQ